MQTTTTITQTSIGGTASAGLSVPEEDGVCDILCQLLLEGIDIHRCQAAQALGMIGGGMAVDALIKALLDEDEDVRTDAAAALVRIGDPRADAQLLENLIGDPCPEVKLAAMTALSASKNDDVKPWLLRILAGRDEEINWDEEEFYATGWDDWLDMQIKAIDALADLGVSEAVAGIVAAISDDDALDICETGMKALARIGSSGVAALAGFMDDRDKRRRRRAAYVLCRCDGPEAEKAVLRAIADPSAEVRLAVTRGLAGVNPADLKLGALLLDDSPEVRAEAVRLCGAEHEKRLDLLLDDKSPEVRREVLDLLARHPELKNTPMLEERVAEILRSSNPSLAASAGPALAAIAPMRAVQELIEALQNEDLAIEVQRGVIAGLKLVGGSDTLQSLTGVLAHDNRQIRLDAMSAIADLAGKTDGPNEAVDTLLAALAGKLVAEPEIEDDEPAAAADEPDEPDEEDSADVVIEENESFPSSTLQAIIGGAKSSDQPGPVADVELTAEDLQYLSLAKSRKLGKRTISVVPDISAHDDVRLFAARLLGDFPHQNTAAALLEAVSGEDKDLKLTAMDSLARISGAMAEWPDEMLPVLLSEAKSPVRDIRLQAVRALAYADDFKATAVLISGLDDDDSFVRSAAIRSLARLGETGAGIARLLADPDPSVRLTAAETMAQADSDVVEPLVDFAFSFEGYHGREAARLLGGLNRRAANACFIEALKEEDRKRYWKVAIEALEELNKVRVPA